MRGVAGLRCMAIYTCVAMLGRHAAANGRRGHRASLAWGAAAPCVRAMGLQRRGLSNMRDDGLRWSRATVKTVITSQDNPRVKAIRALSRKRGRDRDGGVLIEGHRLVLDAAEAGHVPDVVLVTEDALDAPKGPELCSLLQSLPASAVVVCSPPVVASACDTVTPQGVLAVIPRPTCAASFDKTQEAKAGLVLVLDGLQDPGNVGTLIRTAAACGAHEVAVVGGCDPWSPKALRSAMGATFKVAISESSTWRDGWSMLESRWGVPLRWVAADGHPSLPVYDELDWTTPMALIVGNEGAGLGPEVREAMRSGKVLGARIPLANGVESLNAAAAGAILLAEAAKQRRQADR